MRALAVWLLLLLCSGCASIEQMVRPAPPDPKSLMPALELRIAVLIADERSRIAPDAKSLVIDPELGAIFYMFDIPLGSRPMNVERSEKCVNCHTREDHGFVPGIVLNSVIPGPTGGSLEPFRKDRTGPCIPVR